MKGIYIHVKSVLKYKLNTSKVFKHIFKKNLCDICDFIGNYLHLIRQTLHLDIGSCSQHPTFL